MLNIFGRKGGALCDGVSRRDFLRIGGLGLGGLALPDILRAQAAAAGSATGAAPSSNKAVIMIFLAGGPPHQDMFDLKPDAPAEIRGEFRPAKTTVPGVEICEHMPRIARMMDKFAVIRSMVGCSGDHALDQCNTGFASRQARMQQRPSLGAVLSKVRGSGDPGVPAFVGLAPRMGHMPWANPGQPGFLGVSHAPFTPFSGAGSSEDMTLRDITLDRLSDRMALLESFDRFRRDVDASGNMEGLDAFHRQALGVLTSSRLVEALDLSKEDLKVRARYGYGDMKNVDDGGPCCMDQFLMARRLVEAGVRCVTLTFGRWDYHGKNFDQLRERLPKLDSGVSALVGDLHERGLDKDVTVVVWGEFGRTPKINNSAGRDHWPNVSCALLAGGGMRTGQVIGSTDKHAAEAKDRPVTFPEVFSTLYHNLGIDLNTTLIDRTGRPMYLLDDRQPMKELV